MIASILIVLGIVVWIYFAIKSMKNKKGCCGDCSKCDQCSKHKR